MKTIARFSILLSILLVFVLLFTAAAPALAIAGKTEAGPARAAQTETDEDGQNAFVEFFRNLFAKLFRKNG